MLFCQAQTQSITFNKVYQGTINGKLEIKLTLQAKSGQLDGVYFEDNQGYDIELSGKIDQENNIELNELDSNGVTMAKIKGKLIKDSIIGTWQSMNGDRAYPIVLKETWFNIVSLPKTIAGKYVINYDETSEFCKCKLEILISKSKGTYYYHITSEKRNKKGKVKISRDSEANYISFEGLIGDENAGELSGDLSDDSIIIQNTGNSMNYYVRLSECDAKYIYLKKVH